MGLEELISNYGYVVILIGTFLEGETVLVLGGFLAHRGYLELPWVVVAAFAGTVAGDQLFFLIGRRKGMAFLDRHKAWKSKAGRVLALLHTHQTWVILGFRFLYGFRTVAPFLIGASGVASLRYTVFNTLGAAAWALSVAFLGYFLGHTVELILRDVKEFELIIMAVIFVVGVGFWLVHFVMARKDTKPGAHNPPSP